MQRSRREEVRKETGGFVQKERQGQGRTAKNRTRGQRYIQRL